MNAHERQQVATREEIAPPAQVVAADAASLMAVISRAASDPSTDVDKLERLLSMYERITERSAKAAYSSALAEMQPQLPTITERGRIEVPGKDGKAGHSTPFARWEDINDAIRPVLATHGFALSFRVGQAQDGKITITGILSHREGHQEETMITLMHDSSGSKNAVQAVGSSVSYGKRYTAMALLNITTRGEDDDGRSGGQSTAATRAISDINGCETYDDLKVWRAKHFDGLAEIVSDAERKEIVSLYNRRRQALTGSAGK